MRAETWAIFEMTADLPAENEARVVLDAEGEGVFWPIARGRFRWSFRIDDWEGSGLHYVVRQKDQFRGKACVIVGGGDSALDWTLGLQDTARHPIALVHRREQIWLAAVRDESHPCRLKVAADRFKITIPVGSRSVESDHYYRDEYRVVNGVAKRVRAGCYAVEDHIRSIECDESSYAEKIQRTYEIIKKKW